ncbi:hypothetical protein WJX81_000907 [Elliptochloris bilobata]|uniref:START domain-containing protein n=1 Tax=Elliptochloris bilobata TaxID=381761 RepID=A0AAW1RMV6_9CHLO
MGSAGPKWTHAGEPTANVDAVVSAVVAALTLWLLGAVVGLMLPRPKFLTTARWDWAFSSPVGLVVGRLALLTQGAFMIREIWFYFTSPGTFHALARAMWTWLCGGGWRLRLATRRPTRKLRKKGSGERDGGGDIDWYVTEEDLEVFKHRIECDGVVPGAGSWEAMMSKDFGGFTYEAWRRSLRGNKTEYKSVTVANDATAEEFMDFYLDDPTRPKWDSMISETEVLENGDGKHRCQVVRWMRTFPFSFISKREYVIARRMWRGSDGALYGITKAIEHPRAPVARGIVRMDVYYSMWRSRTIPSPDGSGRPACETVLLHHEGFKIPENLARFAVRHGMSGFVKKMGPEVVTFVAERRKRVGPFQTDPDAFGANATPNPPAARCDSAASLVSLAGSEASATDTDSASEAAPVPSRRRRGGGARGPLRRAQQLSLALVATTLAVALSRSGSSRKLAS